MKKYYTQYSILFVFLTIFIFLPFGLKGNSFINAGDAFNQLYPVFVYTGEYIRNFIQNLLNGQIQQYDYSIGFGDDVIGTLNYYGFGSLFLSFSALAPAKYSAILYTAVIVLKLYFSGITFSYFLFTKCENVAKKAVMVATVTYVFSTYSLFYGLQFSNFLDVVVYLPFAFAGIEKLIQEMGKKILFPVFIFGFFAQALSGFYHLYMLTLFGVIYLVVRCLVRQKSARFTLKKICLAAINYFAALSLAAIILIPSVIAYLNSTRTKDAVFKEIIFSGYDKETVFRNLVNIFLKAGYQAGLGVSILSGLAIIMLVFRKGKKEYKILLSIFGMGYFFPVFGSIMNGFAYPTDRWIFILIFLLSSLTAEMLSDKEKIQKKEIIVFILLAFIWSFFYWKINELNIGNILHFAVYVTIWSTTLGILAKLYKQHIISLSKSRLLCVGGILGVALSSFMMNAPVRIGGDGWSAYFMPMKEVYNDIVNSKANIEDRGFFRIDINDTSEAGSLVLHNKGTSSYYSVMNKSIYDFFREMKISSGINNSSFRMKGLDHRDIIRKLLAVKYMESNGNVVQNMQYQKLGLLFDNYCLADQIEDFSDIEKNLLVDRTVILDRTPNIDVEEKICDEWTIESLKYTWDNVNIKKQNECLVAEKNGKIALPLQENSFDYIYLLLTGLQVHNNAFLTINVGENAIKINGEVNQEKLRGDNDYLIFCRNSKEKITIQLEPGEYTIDDVEVYGVNYADFTQKERENIGEVEIFTDVNRIYGTVNANKQSMLFLSIPYSEGWKLYLDGENVDKFKADYGFMALEIPCGEHTIDAVYETPGMQLGIIIAICALTTVVIILVAQRKWRRYENTDAR